MPSGPGERYDFFLSRRGSVAAIAQEVADVLTEKGYKVRTQDYDIPITANFIEKMHEAVKNSREKALGPEHPHAGQSQAAEPARARTSLAQSVAQTARQRGNGAVQKARITVPVTRATIVLIEVGSCCRALWTRPKPTISVTQASASITTFRCVRRLAASSEKLFMTRSQKTSLSLVGASRRKVQPLASIAQMAHP
jgi:hypothetical protein